MFICAVEIRSVWEKADLKQKQDSLRTAAALVRLFGKANVGEKPIENLKSGIVNDEGCASSVVRELTADEDTAPVLSKPDSWVKVNGDEDEKE